MRTESLATIRLFGEFRNWNPAGLLTLPLQSLQTVHDLKNAVAEELGKLKDGESVRSLMKVSALAGESRVLLDSEKLAELGMSSFALLPPVCGG